jgi:flavin-dependent dehydrogenase
LLHRLIATGCPPIHTYDFDFGPFVISGSPGTAESPVSYCPRRTVLDKLLVDGAAEAGAEIREGFSAEELIIENGRVAGIKGHSKNGAAIEDRASIVIGADGRNSMIAAAMKPEQYNEKPTLLAAYYSYWSGVPTHGRFETYIRPHRGMAATETHDNLTVVIVGWPFAEFEANKKDVEGNYFKVLDLAQEFADRVRRGKRETPIAGASLPNFFRKPYGPGWVLIGDAG